MATKTIRNVGYGVNAGRSRQELYDVDYGKCTPLTGNKSIRAPYLLGYRIPGGFLTKEQAYAEAMKPIHSFGDKVNKTIPELLPIFEELPDGKIPGGDPWHPYPAEIPPILIGDYYEGRDDGRYGYVRQYNLYYEVPEDLDAWDNMGVTAWKVRGEEVVYVDNPLYQPAVERNEARKVEYLAILKQFFVMTGVYTFPGYAIGQWEWFEDGVKIGGMNTNPKIALDPNHRLANPTTGWKYIVNVIQENTTLCQQLWKGKVDNTILIVPPQYNLDQRLKLLLGI